MTAIKALALGGALAVLAKSAIGSEVVRLVVAYDSKASMEASKARWESSFNVRVLSQLNMLVMEYEAANGPALFANSLSALDLDPQVQVVEFDSLVNLPPTFDEKPADSEQVLTLAETSKVDPLLRDQWGFRAIGMYGAWPMVADGLDPIRVAVIDTGVDYNHEDLQGHVWINEAEVNGIEGVDDDGNGYIDDFYGWNPMDNNGLPMDDHGHGTHCAGTIAAVANNGIGIKGMHPNVQIVPCRFMSIRGGGQMTDAVTCIDYALSVNASISNNSWGAGHSYILEMAIRRAEEAGHLFVVSAGNSNRDHNVNKQYPSDYTFSNILSVASMHEQYGLSWFSDYGNQTVHIAAPGSGIISTTPNNTYGYKSGTSMAAPMVAGAAALYRSVYPGATCRAVKDAMRRSADMCRTPCQVKWDGRLNVPRMLLQQSSSHKLMNKLTSMET